MKPGKWLDCEAKTMHSPLFCSSGTNFSFFDGFHVLQVYCGKIFNGVFKATGPVFMKLGKQIDCEAEIM